MIEQESESLQGEAVRSRVFDKLTDSTISPHFSLDRGLNMFEND